MSNKTEVVIVTGSSGMIGSALIHTLAENKQISARLYPTDTTYVHRDDVIDGKSWPLKKEGSSTRINIEYR